MCRALSGELPNICRRRSPPMVEQPQPPCLENRWCENPFSHPRPRSAFGGFPSLPRGAFRFHPQWRASRSCVLFRDSTGAERQVGSGLFSFQAGPPQDKHGRRLATPGRSGLLRPVQARPTRGTPGTQAAGAPVDAF